MRPRWSAWILVAAAKASSLSWSMVITSGSEEEVEEEAEEAGGREAEGEEAMLVAATLPLPLALAPVGRASSRFRGGWMRSLLRNERPRWRAWILVAAALWRCE